MKEIAQAKESKRSKPLKGTQKIVTQLLPQKGAGEACRTRNSVCVCVCVFMFICVCVCVCVCVCEVVGGLLGGSLRKVTTKLIAAH